MFAESQAGFSTLRVAMPLKGRTKKRRHCNVTVTVTVTVQYSNDQDERETDGAVHWNSMRPKLRKAFQKAGGQKFSDSDWLQYMYKESDQTMFQYRMSYRGVLLYIRAIQGHSGGNVIALELVGHVAIPYNWKEFLFHR